MTRSSDLELVKKAGRRLRTGHLDVRAADSLLSHARVAIVVAKSGHTIVERNRLRRRLRELARTRLIPHITNLDIVVRTFPSAYGATLVELLAETDEIAGKLSQKPSLPEQPGT